MTATPPQESHRLALLRELQVLDPDREPMLDALTRLAARLTDCPIALVSLVDEARQVFKSRYGLAPAEALRDGAFCAHTILGSERLEVPDALADPRFADNPLVTGPAQVRFYAGVPLQVQGQRLGTLCVIDHQPRVLTEAQRTALDDLARAAMQWFESRWNVLHLEKTQGRLFDVIEAAADWAFEVDPGRTVVWFSAATDSDVAAPFALAVGGRLPDLARLNGIGIPHLPAETLHGAMSSGAAVRRFIVCDTQDGLDRFVSLSLVATRDAQGWFSGHRGVLRDVSVEVHAAAERQRSRVQIESHATGREFMLRLGEVLHRPLEQMTGHASTLLQLAPGVLPAAVLRHLDLVSHAAQRVDRLLQDMRRLLRAEKGVAVESQSVDFDLVAHHAISLHDVLAREFDVRLVHVPAEKAVHALGDLRAVVQILGELISNGIRYNLRRATLTLATSVSGGRARVSVTDQGMGLDAAQLARLFHPFEPLHGDRADDPQHSGLGLVIARALAHTMGGALHAAGTPGEGCVFTLELPLKVDPMVPAVRAPVASPTPEP